jgi:hypothetical protein
MPGTPAAWHTPAYTACTFQHHHTQGRGGENHALPPSCLNRAAQPGNHFAALLIPLQASKNTGVHAAILAPEQITLHA